MAAEPDPPDYNHEAGWEQTGLAAALAAVQAGLPRINKNKTAEVKKDGKLQYTHKYADLADVSEAILPLLAKHGLCFTCAPTVRDDGRFVLEYALIHVSGGKIGGTYPLPEAGRPQDIGGYITYARRYALGAVTGVAAEEDTDGRGEPQPRQRQQAKPRGEANGHPQHGKDDPGSATKGQITGIQIAYKELGFDPRTEREDVLAASEQIIGRPLTGPHDGRTHNNLTGNEARKLRDTLGGFEDRGDLLAKLVEAATP